MKNIEEPVLYFNHALGATEPDQRALPLDTTSKTSCSFTNLPAFCCNRLPKGLGAFYQRGRTNRYRPAGLIQDEPRGLFIDLLILKDSSKITACRRNMENKTQG